MSTALVSGVVEGPITRIQAREGAATRQSARMLLLGTAGRALGERGGQPGGQRGRARPCHRCCRPRVPHPPPQLHRGMRRPSPSVRSGPSGTPFRRAPTLPVLPRFHDLRRAPGGVGQPRSRILYFVHVGVISRRTNFLLQCTMVWPYKAQASTEMPYPTPPRPSNP
jgi:hypothetical protein